MTFSWQTNYNSFAPRILWPDKGFGDYNQPTVQIEGFEHYSNYFSCNVRLSDTPDKVSCAMSRTTQHSHSCRFD